VLVLVLVLVLVGQDSAFGSATDYGLDGLGAESRWRIHFQGPSRPALRSTQPPAKLVSGLFPGATVARALH